MRASTTWTATDGLMVPATRHPGYFLPYLNGQTYNPWDNQKRQSWVEALLIGNYQIDNVFGYAATLAELLIQRQDGFVHLLPALPDKWKNSFVKGLRAP